LKKLLAKESDFLLLAEAKNGIEVLEQIQSMKPDLIFLDIQMPDMDGLKVVRKLNPETMPYIVFVTAYDKYAIKAFELFALDYLLKPFDNQRFALSIERIRKTLSEKARTQFSDKLMQLISDYKTDLPNSFITIRQDGYDKKVMAKDIILVEAYSNYLKIHSRDETILYRASFEKLQNELQSDIFLRVHRSFLLNRHFIARINYLGNKEYQIQLINGESVKSGRNYYQSLSEYLSAQH
ncbi:MAG: response regulator, partial [Calditrichaeota bacterium]|nr:response regulator [Calditrichota bacterium]